MSVSVHQVADYLLHLAHQKGELELDAMAVQKLLYYVQGFHLGAFKKPLFAEQIEHWDRGPVVPRYWDTHRGSRSLETDNIPEQEFEQLSKEAKTLIKTVYDRLGRNTGWALSDMTHAEPCWRETERNQEITAQILQEHFEDLITQNHDGSFVLADIQVHKIPYDHRLHPVLLLEDLETGHYVASCPDFPGCFSEGVTVKAAMENIVDAVNVWHSTSLNAA